MKFNYSKLLGKIKECGFTHENLAVKIGIAHSTLSAKLNNRNAFTTKEIGAICKVLNIPKKDVGLYFFAE